MSGAHSRSPRRLPRALAAVVALAVLFIPVSGDAESKVGGSVTLDASKASLVDGGWVRFAGTFTAAGVCQEGREVRLRSVQTGGVWATLKTGHTDANGAFSFGVQPDHSAKYDVWIPAIGSCERVVSTPAVPVAVAARVVVTEPPNGVDAGSCGALKASVQPAHPGTPVRFQRLAGSAWRTVGTAPLGSDSPATFQVCGGWEDIGTQTWRASWSAADAGATDNADGVSSALAVQVVEAPWMVHVDQLIGSRNVGVAVASDGDLLYEHGDTVAHVPASNEKLLLSMALLARVSPDAVIETTAEAGSMGTGGVIHGGLWLIGRGDPTVSRLRLARLADDLVNAGLTKITGSVMGSTAYFSHDWWATGWKPEFPAEEVALPTALTFMGNSVDGRHVAQPERIAAAALTKMLRARGVEIVGDAKSGVPPGGLHPLARMISPPLRRILHDQNIDSINFDAEVLGKLLGIMASGQPGTIAKGAAAIHAWAAAHGATVTTNDASGLSYANRATALGIVKLLEAADAAPWGAVLRSTLPTPGEGTLEHRLQGISVQAKTGTLDDISALSGWVDLSRTGHAAQFSILSGGYDVSNEKDVEDAIVTTLARNAH